MSVEVAKNLRVELHYGIIFIEKALDEGTNKTGAITKLIEARSAMAAYISSLKGKYYFPEVNNFNNEVIEMDPDVVDEQSLPQDVPASVYSVKTSINALGMAIEKVLSIRLNRMQQLDPKNSYRALRSLDRTIDCIESCVGYLVNELHDISAKEPGKYPTFIQTEEIPAAGTQKFDPAANSNAIMEERAGGTAHVPVENPAEELDQDPGSENTGSDEPSGPVPENEEFHQDENGQQGTTPSDPTEGFSETNQNPEATQEQ